MQSLNIKDRTVLRLFAGPDYAYAFLLELRREPIPNLKPVLATIRLHRNCHKINRLTPSKSKPKLFLLRHSDEVFSETTLFRSVPMHNYVLCVCVCSCRSIPYDGSSTRATYLATPIRNGVGWTFIYLYQGVIPACSRTEKH